MKEKILILFLAFLLLSPAVNASTEDKLDARVRLPFTVGVGAATIADFDSDGFQDIIVADKNNTLSFFDSDGKLRLNVSIGNVNDTGTVKVLRMLDVDADGELELVLGTLGKRELVEHPWNEYNKSDQTIVRYGRVLFKTLRNMGRVIVYEHDLTLKWTFDYETSVQDIDPIDIDSDENLELILGTGDFSRDEWWVHGPDYANDRENWTLLEYFTRNGSVVLLDDDGSIRWIYNLTEKEVIEEDVPDVYTFNLVPIINPNGETAKNAKVRVVHSADLFDSGEKLILAGSDNGYIYVLSQNRTVNWTYYVGSDVYLLHAANLEGTPKLEVIAGAGDNTLYVLDSNGKLIWKYRFSGEPKSIEVSDVDNDGSVEILVGNRDNYMYVFYGNGNLKWKQYLGHPVYDITLGDVDNDSFVDMLLASDYNVTLYEMRESYVKKEEAEYYYRIAQEQYDAGDYTLAIIYLDRARELYSEIRDPSGFPKIDLLLDLIRSGVESDKKRIADFNYDKALDFYGINKYNESITYIRAAREIYQGINDTVGVQKADRLLTQIRTEMRGTRKFEADGLYSSALNLYNFRNYSGSTTVVGEAKLIYKEIGDSDGIGKSDKLLGDVAVAYFDSAKRYEISIDYDNALASAGQAKLIYADLGNQTAVSEVEAFMSGVEAKKAERTSEASDMLSKFLPVVLAVLILVLLISIFRKSKGRGPSPKEPPISDVELEELSAGVEF
ncbi:MAG: hypothetical protein V1921_08885 [Candidatus Altiarchaeota archaeon]